MNSRCPDRFEQFSHLSIPKLEGGFIGIHGPILVQVAVSVFNFGEVGTP